MVGSGVFSVLGVKYWGTEVPVRRLKRFHFHSVDHSGKQAWCRPKGYSFMFREVARSHNDACGSSRHSTISSRVRAQHK